MEQMLREIYDWAISEGMSHVGSVEVPAIAAVLNDKPTGQRGRIGGWAMYGRNGNVRLTLQDDDGPPTARGIHSHRAIPVRVAGSNRLSSSRTLDRDDVWALIRQLATTLHGQDDATG